MPDVPERIGYLELAPRTTPTWPHNLYQSPDSHRPNIATLCIERLFLSSRILVEGLEVFIASVSVFVLVAQMFFMQQLGGSVFPAASQ